MSNRNDVGVINPFVLVNENGLNTSPLKRLAIAFNQLFIHDLSTPILKNKEFNKQNPEAIADLNWLLENGILIERNVTDKIKIENPEYENLMAVSETHVKQVVNSLFDIDLDELLNSKNKTDYKKLLRNKIDSLTKLTKEDLKKKAEIEEFKESVILAQMHLTRMKCIEIRELENLDALPILPIKISENKDAVDKNDVFEIVVNSLPIPNDSTPWEQILEFRANPDSYSKFLALRNWINETARGQLSPIEIEQKLEYLLDQYRQHMNLHKIKTNAGLLETIVVTGGEVLGNLITFQWGKSAKALFALKSRKIALLEGELTSPGNEVAYIIKAQESFK